MKTQHGYSLLELLVVLSLIGILMGIATFDLKALDNKARSGAALTSAFIKQSRASAMSTTRAYRVSPASNERLIAEYANTCSSGTWTADPRLILDLPGGSAFDSTGWSLCFNSRGFPDSNSTVALSDNEGNAWNIEVLLGGSTRYYE